MKLGKLNNRCYRSLFCGSLSIICYKRFFIDFYIFFEDLDKIIEEDDVRGV